MAERDNDRDVLTSTIRGVTDLWDEPLDEVHDVPPLVNAILAADFRRIQVTDEMVDRFMEKRASMLRGWTSREAVREQLEEALRG